MNDIISQIQSNLKLYPYFKQFDLNKIFQGNFCEQVDLTLFFVNLPYYKGDNILKIVFENVSDMKIMNLFALGKVFLDIEDIKDYQRENTRYKVIDCEEELIKLYCYDIIISIVKQ